MFNQLLTRNIIRDGRSFQGMDTDPESIDFRFEVMFKRVRLNTWNITTDETYDRNGQPFQLIIVRSPSEGGRVLEAWEYQEFPASE